MTKRKVAPYQVWFYDGSFYLIGLCNLADEIRIFAFDRIKMLHTTEETFDIPSDFDLNALMHRSFGVFQGPREGQRSVRKENRGIYPRKSMARLSEDP